MERLAIIVFGLSIFGIMLGWAPLAIVCILTGVASAAYLIPRMA